MVRRAFSHSMCLTFRIVQGKNGHMAHTRGIFSLVCLAPNAGKCTKQKTLWLLIRMNFSLLHAENDKKR